MGVQVPVYLDGELLTDSSAGHMDESKRQLIDGSTLFTFFSVSRAIAARALHIQAERVRIEYDQPAARARLRS